MATIFFVAIGIVVALILLAFIAGSSPAAQKQREQAAAEQAAKLNSLSTIDGFQPAMIYPGKRESYGLAIDPASDQFAIAITGHPPRLYHFSQLVAVEVDRNGETITRTEGKVDTKRAALATALIGPLGMAAGAKTSSTSTTSTTITKLALKLYVSDLYTPCFEVPFLTAFGVGMEASGSLAKDAMTELDAWFGRFKTILVETERQGAIDASRAIQHRSAAPAPTFTALGWGARTFGA